MRLFHETEPGVTSGSAVTRRGGYGKTSSGDTDFTHLGIMNDYVRIPYATGSSFASQLLYSEFTRRGHDVTVIGARDPNATDGELPDKRVLFPGVPVRSQPGFYLPLPAPKPMKSLANQGFDMLLGQTGSELMDAGVWLRITKGVPLVCVNTTMLSQLYDVMLPEKLHHNRMVQKFCKERVVPFVDQASVRVYNESDGLIVLSKGLEQYWRDRGVRVPIHVIPRSVNPRVVSAKVGKDPFHPRAKRGQRLLVLCRLVREKYLSRIIDIFAKYIAPRMPEATLTLVGDGADHDAFVAQAQRLKVGDRVFFPGEFPVTEVRTWYAHADLFMYASLSETYGQVVSEAMYCGLPVVAFDDKAGVAQQIHHGRDGLLLPPGPERDEANGMFGAQVVHLLQNPERRHRLADAAHRSASLRASPERFVQRYYAAFEQARRHRGLCRPDADTLAAVKPIARWLAVHSIAGAASLIRPATVLNRHGRRQPGWEGHESSEVSSSLPMARSA